jgi:tol-pal system protein YbgF
MPPRSLCAALSVAPVFALVACSLTATEPDPVQVKLDDVDRRVGQVERVVNNQSLVEMAQRVDALQSELQQLRGQVEELENANAALRKQQRDLYADLDGRLNSLTGAAGVGAVAAPAVPGTRNLPAVAPPAELPDAAQQAYGKAFDALKAGQYAQAIKGFQEYLARYPQSPLSDNAQYWLGEAFYVTRDYPQALSAFTRVSTQWPESRKLADALVKRGFTLFEMNRLAEARTALNDVAKRFPGTEAARLAAERLKRIPADAV